MGWGVGSHARVICLTLVIAAERQSIGEYRRVLACMMIGGVFSCKLVDFILLHKVPSRPSTHHSILIITLHKHFIHPHQFTMLSTRMFSRLSHRVPHARMPVSVSSICRSIVTKSHSNPSSRVARASSIKPQFLSRFSTTSLRLEQNASGE